jgi:hypothetical protein
MTVKTAEMMIEEVEFLASKLESLCKSEDLAQDVNPSMYRDLVRVHRQTLKQIKMLVQRFLKYPISVD